MNIDGLFHHLKHCHGRYQRCDRYACAQNQCGRTFKDKYHFSKHIMREHAGDVHSISNCTDGSACNSSIWPVTAVSDEVMITASIDSECGQDPATRLDLNVRQMSARFIAEAKSKIATLSSVQSVIGACQDMFVQAVDYIYAMCKSLQTTEKNSCEKWNGLFSKLNELRDPFAGLHTEYAQSNYFVEAGVYVQPIDYAVGTKQSFKLDTEYGSIVPARETVTAQYVSIEETILALQSNVDLASLLVLKPRQQSESHVYCNFFDGMHWLSNPFHDDQNVIVLRLYGDDFEPANPLGSRKASYKIGCIYFQFENLATHILTKTENMFLCLCYHAGDIKEFGWEAILRPLILELQRLGSIGIRLTGKDGAAQTWKVTISAVTGDNLFLNGILGFVESFSAAHPCRHCLVPKAEFQSTFKEDEDMLRSCDSYDRAVENINVTETGIKQNCALNSIPNFHAAQNYVQDIMHDLFEGVCAYDMPLICAGLIARKYFTLQTLNHKVQTFDLGRHEKSNKPPFIVSLDVEQLPFDASQCWCFTRILSVAVGDLVPFDDAIWSFYLKLCGILDLVIAPSITESEVDQLSVLITEYLEHRSVLFPSSPLKNKHHHLIHYPRLIKQVGPLIRFWCMRFESKHQRSKRLIHISGNFKNVLQTCASRHQQYIAYHLLNKTCCSETATEIGPGSVVILSELTNGSDINASLGNVGPNFELFLANWVSVCGITYKPGMCVLSSFAGDDNYPVFLEIENIFVRDHGQHIWLSGEKLNTLYFDTHYNAWIVDRIFSRCTACVDPVCMQYYRPVVLKSIQTQLNNLLCISLHHGL
jgi:hypothetical protein